ncbi:hypothetical protein [Nocardia sp. NPDC050793]|uniref:hypothetical protein n=1 Tax=Nocardia sp. NPDC050793 TaxID=3155159 RepID=UPI0033C173F1
MRSWLLDWYDRLIDGLAQRISDRITERPASTPTVTHHVHLGAHTTGDRLAEHVARARSHMQHYR